MAQEKKQRKAKAPGRIRQMIQVYRTTKTHDPNLTLILLLSFIAPIVITVAAAAMLDGGILGWIMWPLTGALVGLLIAMIILGRRAERVAYRQLEGRPGAVGAVIGSALKRSWRGSDAPVAITRQQDAVYRVVGKGGVVLIAEGSAQRTKRLLTDEQRKLRRALPNVPLTTLYVGAEEGGLELHKLPKTLLRMKSSLNRNEVQAVFNRLTSLQSSPIGIPKGIDPFKTRAPRPR